MAATALYRYIGKLTSAMARPAIEFRMNTYQGEPCRLVMLGHFRRRIPSRWSVALLALIGKLSTVNIKVAIEARSSSIREDQRTVTLQTFHLSVPACERELGVPVVESQYRQQLVPPARRVTLAALER